MTDERFQLYDPDGRRKYLTAAERTAFLSAAETAPREVRTFSMVLAFTGCRISEALALTADRVDLTSHTILFETLKKRRRGIYRAVPVPPALTDSLNLVHAIREAQSRKGGGRDQLLWPFSRTTAWRYVQEILNRVGLEGPQATPKGFRHGFGVQAVVAGIPLNLVQKWLGHAQLSTTAIYADAVGAEEHQIMEKMWGGD